LPEGADVAPIAAGPDGKLATATSVGVFERSGDEGWQRLRVADGLGRLWAEEDVRGVAYDMDGRLWVASLAGVACRDADRWTFYTGSDGLPYNDFTCAAAGSDGSVWFGTTRGAVRFHDGRWSYRQGLRWLPNDEVRAVVVDGDGTAWFATAGGVGCIARESMSLLEKAAYYEAIIDEHIKRTPYGYTAEVSVETPGDVSVVHHHDSDNDGLWTAMYGASQCYAYAVTCRETSRQRASDAFEALRFLQKVTQGGQHSPPKGYVARTILPTDGRDPNEGRLEQDQREQATGDVLWKAYEPRWPKSADGKWYWKSDTSSDELDGHYFFYGLYYDLVAETDEEKERVREVVRDLTDHIIEHDFVLMDHDGQPTRWSNYRPSVLNYDVHWIAERGLNSLSMLSYLATARHVTGDERYDEVAETLMRDHAYHTNAMVPKLQRGIGSGNQSDDEMAFMSFYNLIRYTNDEALRKQFLTAFYAYWLVEEPECNPFFNFAYAAAGLGQMTRDQYRAHSRSPHGDWLETSIDVLRDFPLDRFNWGHQNSHRLDLVRLPYANGIFTFGPNRGTGRGYRVDGKVLPVSERHFNHWNTDPWDLDYGGDGRGLASGTVFLLPYYMGRYHGFFNESG
ncbi:MAG: hypothetical protein KDA63_11600, partial [Planctomycetales bacterium]|nr:hypothetical protein [Planctomycetales bacterium]